MLLSEMVRRINDECQLVNDPTQYSTSSVSYVTVASYNITLNKASALIYSYELRNSAGETYATFARLKIGTLFIGGEASFSTTFEQNGGVFALDAGSYTIELQLRCNSSYVTAFIRNFMLGVISFSDFSFVVLRASGATNISLQSRKTCAGITKNATLIIQVYNMATPTVTVNGVNISPVLRRGEKYVYAVPVAFSSHSINVSDGNYSAVMSPWLLPALDSEFISLSFPQGSTLYIILEPLWNDPAKTVKLGKRRAVSFGDSTDFYSIASGTGILSWNYTFESVEVEQAVLLVSGLGGCISIIAVDVRA